MYNLNWQNIIYPLPYPFHPEKKCRVRVFPKIFALISEFLCISGHLSLIQKRLKILKCSFFHYCKFPDFIILNPIIKLTKIWYFSYTVSCIPNCIYNFKPYYVQNYLVLVLLFKKTHNGIGVKNYHYHVWNTQ